MASIVVFEVFVKTDARVTAVLVFLAACSFAAWYVVVTSCFNVTLALYKYNQTININ